jgi:PAS domain S-box-containing protein
VSISSPEIRRLLLILALASVVLPQVASAQNPDRVVRVGLFQLDPIIFQDGQGHPGGLYVDLMDKIAEQEDWQVQYVAGTWAEGLQSVRRGDLDLMTVIIRTPERDRYLDFCSENVMMVWGQIFAKENDPIQNILDLEGRRVAVMTDDLNGLNFMENARRFAIDCQIVETGSHAGVFQMVQRGEVAAGVAPNIFGYTHSEEYGLVPTPIVFDPSSITFAAPEGRNADLLTAIDRQLARWKSDPDSYYYQTIGSWIGQGTSASQVVPRWLLVTLGGVGLLALLLLLWNRSLDSQVKARTQELQNSEAKIRGIFDQTFQFLGVLDTDGRLQEVNQTALDFIGARPAEVLGKLFWDCPWWNHDPAVRREVRLGVQKALGGQIHFGESTHPDPEGNLHRIEYTIKPVFNESGEVVMVIPEGHDISEKDRLASDLRQSQKMESIGTLAGGIAHDFNNILSAIIGFNEMALQDTAGQPQVQDSLKEVALATERARNLVQQILTFSRRREAEKAVIQPGPLVEEAVKLLRSSLPSTIAIDLELQSESTILADPTQIHQVVMNLGTNAFHAMEDEGGTLGVQLSSVELSEGEPVLGGEIPPGRYVALQVSDTGTGMAESMIGKIFDPYFTSKAAGKGTGLGLSVVHGIVQSSRGYLRVSSQLGRGTTFQLFFPVAEKQAAADPAAGHEAESFTSAATPVAGTR